MNYNVIKIEQAIVTKPGNNLNNVYAKISLEEPNSGEVRVVPVFDQEAKTYLPFIGKEADLPDNKKQWLYCFDEEFVFPENKPMIRVDDNGQPILNKHNQMYQRTSVVVMTRYQMDQDWALLHPGQSPLRPKRGWDLTSRGTSVMNAFYVPMTAVTQVVGPSPIEGGPAPANIAV